MPSDDTDRKQCLAFVDQLLTEAAGGRATGVLFRPEMERVQTFLLVDGKYEKGLAIPATYWELILHILRSDYFESGQYQLQYQGALCVFEWHEDPSGIIRLGVERRPVPGRRAGGLEDIFSAFEDPSWDSVKSIFLSVLNLALEQGFDGIVMELDGPLVEVGYYKEGVQRTGMTISSDSYDALARLIGENYLAFGFMTREFREKEYLVRLVELNEDEVAPRIRLEIEELE